MLDLKRKYFLAPNELKGFEINSTKKINKRNGCVRISLLRFQINTTCLKKTKPRIVTVVKLANVNLQCYTCFGDSMR